MIYINLMLKRVKILWFKNVHQSTLWNSPLISTSCLILFWITRINVTTILILLHCKFRSDWCGRETVLYLLIFTVTQCQLYCCNYNIITIWKKAECLFYVKWKCSFNRTCCYATSPFCYQTENSAFLQTGLCWNILKDLNY
jgi:hypothetical protein